MLNRLSNSSPFRNSSSSFVLSLFSSPSTSIRFEVGSENDPKIKRPLLSEFSGTNNHQFPFFSFNVSFPHQLSIHNNLFSFQDVNTPAVSQFPAFSFKSMGNDPDNVTKTKTIPDGQSPQNGAIPEIYKDQDTVHNLYQSPKTEGKGETTATENPIKDAPKAQEKLVSSEATVESSWNIVKRMFHFVWPKNDQEIRQRVMIALALLVAAKFINVSIPYFFKAVIDSMNADLLSKALFVVPTTTILSYGIARISSTGFNELRNALFAKVSQQSVRKLATRTFRHLHELDHKFHMARQTGGLTRAIDRGTRSIDFLLRSIVFHMAPTLFEVGLVSGILAFSFGAPFAYVTLTTLGIYTAFTLGVTQWRTKFRQIMNKEENDAASKGIDSLLNYETVKFFSNENLEVQRYHDSLQRYQDAAIKTQTSLSLLNFGQGLIFSTGLTGMLYMASGGIVAGTMTLGDLVMVQTLLMQLSFPLNFLGTVYRELRQGTLDVEAMFNLLSHTGDIKESPDAVPLVVNSELGASISFSNVSFSYEEANPILNNLSLKILAGQKVGIVGPSGCGKSTLLKLLFRFYDPKSGNIQVDDFEIRDLTVKSLRNSIGVVPQDTVLFNDTIRYNILYGNPNATEEQVQNAIRLASVDHLIEKLPNGLDSLVGERGLKLSGGEKQRISIARVLLKNPSIFLCDEATSSLDSRTEEFVMDTLKSATGNKTCVFVAHRLSTVMDCDNIIVLEGGKVKEQGTHTQLIANDSLYASLWKHQSQLREEEEEVALE